MFLAIDIGNTNIVCGLYDGSDWIHQFRISSDLNFWDEFKQLKKFNIKKIGISSVVPTLTLVIYEAAKNLFNINPLIITSKNANIKLKVDHPLEVGSDRICNIASAKKIGLPSIVGDIGSATNFDVINSKGAFIGGVIAPGIQTAAHNLFKKAALLKEIAFTMPNETIGKNTKTNLQSGIMFGAIDSIDGMFKRIKKESGWDNTNYIITGGFGKIISPYLQTEHILSPNLTLDGIRLIYESQ